MFALTLLSKVGRLRNQNKDMLNDFGNIILKISYFSKPIFAMLCRLTFGNYVQKNETFG